jgi:hypothetical protein
MAFLPVVPPRSTTVFDFPSWSADMPRDVPVFVSDSTIGCRMEPAEKGDVAFVVNGIVCARIVFWSGGCFSTKHKNLETYARASLGDAFGVKDFAVVPASSWWQMHYMGGERKLPHLNIFAEGFRAWMDDSCIKRMHTKAHMKNEAVEYILLALLPVAAPLNLVAGWNANDERLEFRNQLAFASWAIRHEEVLHDLAITTWDAEDPALEWWRKKKEAARACFSCGLSTPQVCESCYHSPLCTRCCEHFVYCDDCLWRRER